MLLLQCLICSCLPLWKRCNATIVTVVVAFPHMFNRKQAVTRAGFASQSLLTGLGSVQFISNLIFAVVVLRESVPKRCVLATVLIVAGNVVLVVFGSKESPNYSVAQLATLYRQDSMVAYMMLAYAGGQPLAHSWHS